MFEQIKNNVEKSLRKYVSSLEDHHGLGRISPDLNPLFREYLLRPGKRVRPVLFCAGYLGFARKERPGIYTSALSIELLHDFMLIHDDIIDRSDTRRGLPAMHKVLEKRFCRQAEAKFSGQDLAIVAGDILYAMAVQTFLAIQEEPARKEKALRRFIDAAMFTGSGEFIELVYGATRMEDVREADIYKIYDYKTACYTFASPLSIGAILGGAPDADTRRLFDYGICLGRAFQIKDDILGIFGDEKKIGKSVLTDLQESKKTLLVFYAFRDSGEKDRRAIKRVFAKNSVTRDDLAAMRAVITRSGALAAATAEINACAKKAAALLERSSMRADYKRALAEYTRSILQV